MATYYVDIAVGNDLNTGTSPGAGNAWATIGKAASTIVQGDIVNIKSSGVYSLVLGITITNSFASGFTQKTRLIGYTTTPGDGGKATVRAVVGMTIFTLNQQGLSLESLDIDGNNVSGVTGVSMSALYTAVVNCLIRRNTSGSVVTSASFCRIVRCELTGNTGGNGAIAFTTNDGQFAVENYVHDNTVTGIYFPNNAFGAALGNVVTNNTGSSSDGIYLFYGVAIRSNTCHGNGRDGIRIDDNYIGIISAINYNLLTSNSGYGLNMTGSPGNTVTLEVDNNTFYNNTSGAIHNITHGPGDVTLSAIPYTNAGSNDFTLNNNAGGGAACTNVAVVLPGGTSYTFMGALGPLTSTGGGTTTVYSMIF